MVSKPYVMPDDPEEGSVEALQKEAADARDKMLRTLAEMENLRKRTSKEVADARAYGITGFARDILDIADNLQRALDAVPAEAKANADPGLKALIEGVELTERSLLNTLEKNGVKKFDPSGEKFDPNFQQAMYEVPDPSVPAGTVVQVVQAGYTIGERVLRPALVGVVQGRREGRANRRRHKLSDEARATHPAAIGFSWAFGQKVPKLHRRLPSGSTAGEVAGQLRNLRSLSTTPRSTQ